MNLNKKIGRIFKFVLSLTMAMAICIGNFADINQIFKVSAAAAKVATLTVHSETAGGHYGLPTGQHSFLSIRNKANYNINILGTTVYPDGAITIGTSDSMDGQGAGIYTNAEAWLIKYKGMYKTRVSLSMDITLSELYSLEDYMLSINKWNWANNCSRFAEKSWNHVAPWKKHIYAGQVATPVGLAATMRTFKDCKTATKIGTCDKGNVRRVKSRYSTVKINMRNVV